MPYRTRLIGMSVALGMTLAVAQPLWAAEVDLAKVLPGPSVLYVGWTGADATQGAFDKTALGQMLAEPEFVRLFEGVCPQIQALINQYVSKRKAADLEKPLREVLGMLWRHPGAINVMRLMLLRDGVEVQAAAVWHLGGEAERFEALVQPMLADLLKGLKGKGAPPATMAVGEFTLNQVPLGKGLPEITWGRVGEYYVLALGQQTPAAVVDCLRGQSDKRPLAENEAFAAARKGLGAQTGTMVVNWFVSVEEIVRRLPLVGTALDLQRAKGGGTKDAARLPLGILFSRASRALGLKEIKSLSGGLNLDGDAFRIAWYLHAPGATSGVMTLFHQKPVTDAELSVVPRDSDYFYATNLDLGAFYQEMMTALKEIDPNMHEEWQALLGEAERRSKVKLVDDLLASLDDGWIVYDAPSSGGVLGTGLTLVVEAKDAARADSAVTAVVETAIEQFGGREVTLRTTKAGGGRTVHFIESKVRDFMGVVAPAWGSVGKYFVFGLYPQMVVAALERLGGGDLAGDSILKNPDFAARRSHVPGGSNAIGYLDARTVLGRLYRLTLPLASAASMQLGRAGLDFDVSLWPRAQTVERHLFGMVTGLSANNEGVLMVSNGPLPVPMPTARSAALVLGVMSVEGGRGSHEAGVHMAELHTIWAACLEYAEAHDGKMPPSFDALVEAGIVPEREAWMSRYAYVPGLTEEDPEWCVLAYEAGMLRSGAKMVPAVLVGGTFRMMPAGKVKEDLKRTRALLSERPSSGPAAQEKH